MTSALTRSSSVESSELGSSSFSSAVNAGISPSVYKRRRASDHQEEVKPAQSLLKDREKMSDPEPCRIKQEEAEAQIDGMVKEDSEELSKDVETHVKSAEKTQSETEHSILKDKTAIKCFLCTQCGKSFRHKCDLTRHTRIHTGEKPYQCSHCDKRFRDAGYLKKHERIHTGEKPYHCTDCGKSYTQSTALRTHRLKYHDLMVNEESEVLSEGEEKHVSKEKTQSKAVKGITCTQCGKSFRCKYYLKLHMMIHAGEKPHKCDQCSKAFLRHFELKNHLRVHTNEKPYSCSECSWSFTHQHYLKAHQKIHTGVRDFVCFECGNTFIRARDLKQHQRTHTVVKRHKCSHCNKRFSHLRTLKAHARIHTRATPDSPSHCSNRFNQFNSEILGEFILDPKPL